ncbi:GNAT family N-acetyltransferase [Spirillospora sp. NPDC050679]
MSALLATGVITKPMLAEHVRLGSGEAPGRRDVDAGAGLRPLLLRHKTYQVVSFADRLIASLPGPGREGSSEDALMEPDCGSGIRQRPASWHRISLPVRKATVTVRSQPMTEFGIRAANAEDVSEVDRLYEICVRTAAAGQDATEMFDDPRLPGDIFVGPYLRYAPDLAWVLARADESASGYVLGVADTISFEETLEREWWPALRDRRNGEPVREDTADAQARKWIAHPRTTPTEIASEYPAHLHIDLLPEAQGGGNGSRLIHTLLAALRTRGVRGVHLGVGKANTRAIGFYRHLGFENLAEEPGAFFLGMKLQD